MKKVEGVERIREIALADLDKGYVESLKYCIDNVKEMGKEVHPQSIEALKVAVSTKDI